MNLTTTRLTADPLAAADLDRKTNPGNIYDLHRAAIESCAACNGSCHKSGACNCFMPAEACTELGADPEPRVIRRFWSLYAAAMVVALIAGAASLSGCSATPGAAAVVPAAAPMGDPVDYPGRWYYVMDRDCPTWRDCT